MRTTITLDEDVVAKLREDMRRTGRSLKEAVNENLRAGLASGKNGKAKKFVVRPKDMGPIRPGLSLDCIAKLIDQVEGPMHR